MDSHPHKHRRRSIRLKDYDYSQGGAYFITVCTRKRENLFGNVTEGQIQLNRYGKVVNDFWDNIPTHFPSVDMDAFVVMPNHVHGIILIHDACRGGVIPPTDNGMVSPSRGEVTSPLRKISLGQIVAFYKYQTAKLVNQIRNTPGVTIWQRNYHDHIIRDDEHLNKIREYVFENPLKWDLDDENPNR
jgi:putative transposase